MTCGNVMFLGAQLRCMDTVQVILEAKRRGGTLLSETDSDIIDWWSYRYYKVWQ